MHDAWVETLHLAEPASVLVNFFQVLHGDLLVLVYWSCASASTAM